MENMSSNNKKSLICFPNELIENILLRLSPNHLSLLRLTCKHLKLLIESPRFVDYYHKQPEETNINVQLVSIITSNRIYTIELEKLMVGKSPNINEYRTPKEDMFSMVKGTIIPMGSCNGLLCFTAGGSNTISLYNPLTQAHYTFLCPPPKDQCTSACFYGFGYDRSTYDYKVVCIVWGSVECPVYVCSLRTKSWKLTQFFPRNPKISTTFYSYRSIFVNNALHWHVALRDAGSKFSSNVILCFDLFSEKLSFFPVPTEIEKAGYCCYVALDMLDGNLCIFYQDQYKSMIWVMKQYGVKESWSKLATIQSDFVGSVNLVALSKDSSKLLLCEHGNHFNWEAKLYCYDIDSSKRIWNTEIPFMKRWSYLMRTTQNKLTLPLDELK